MTVATFPRLLFILKLPEQYNNEFLTRVGSIVLSGTK